MNRQTDKDLLNNSSDTARSVLESAGAAAGILSDATQDFFKIFSTLGATELAELLSSSSWCFAPGGWDYLALKLPALMQSQFECAMKTALDSAAVLFRTQQQLLEWQTLSLSKSERIGAIDMSPFNIGRPTGARLSPWGMSHA
ncbi:MAG: hypothetical protein ACOYNZ_08345 [Rhodoferax sp.]